MAAAHLQLLAEAEGVATAGARQVIQEHVVRAHCWQASWRLR